MFSHILLASDGSQGANRAADAAAVLAERFAARLSIVAVYHHTTVLLTPGEPLLDDLTDREDEGLTEADDGLSAIMDDDTFSVFGDGGPPSHIRKRNGTPAEEIGRAAEEIGADLIVLGSRGLSGVQSVLLGSVSDAVAHHAHCPVLIVR